VEGVVEATPPPSSQSRTRVHVDDLNLRIVEGEPGRWGRAGLVALA
jgi:hypothetical protein